MYPGCNVGSGVGPAAVGCALGDGDAEPPAGVKGPGEPLERIKKTGPLLASPLGEAVGTGKGVSGTPLGRGVM